MVADRTARRVELLDAADRVVAREGVAASMSAIAAEAGITKPILYRHFGDKSGLYAALAERHTERLMQVLIASLSARGGPRERIATTIEAYLQAIEAEPGIYRFLLHSGEAAEAPPVRGQVHGFLERLAGLLATGIARELGLDAAATRPRVWARAIVGMVQACGDSWISTGTPAREELVRELTELLWGAYRDAAGSLAGAMPAP